MPACGVSATASVLGTRLDEFKDSREMVMALLRRVRAASGGLRQQALDKDERWGDKSDTEALVSSERPGPWPDQVFFVSASS